SARAFEHSNSDQHRDQKRNDSQNHVERFFRTFHELVVNLDAARGGVDWEKAEQERDRQDRQRVDHSRERILQGRIGRKRKPKHFRHHHSREQHHEKDDEQRERNHSPWRWARQRRLAK